MISHTRHLGTLLTPDEQEAWLRNPAGFNRANEEEDMSRLQEFEDHPAYHDCLSLLTTFALCCLPVERSKVWGLLNVSKDKFRERYSTDDKFKQRHPEIHVEEDPYNHPGFGHCCLNADDLESLRQLLTDEAVLSASAALNLKLMQRRPTIYSQFHNPALARLMCSAYATGESKSEGTRILRQPIY